MRLACVRVRPCSHLQSWPAPRVKRLVTRSAGVACDSRWSMVLSSLGPSRVFSAPITARVHFPLRVGAKASQRHFYKHMSVGSDEAAAAAADVAVPLGNENGDSRPELNPDEVLVQYVVLRRDLIDSWPLGSVVTQGCHASVAAVWLSRNDPQTVDYCSEDNLDSMHKATYLSPSLPSY